MRTRTISAPGSQFERAQHCFELWRKTRRRCSPIPETLWSSAVELAGEHGLHRTARMLRLNYYSLKKRFRLIQQHSGPVLERLHAWLRVQFAEKRVEPNSGLGSAITYCLKHWDRLTLFLRQAGAPLDNNIVERALKKALLHRKNSLFYKTENGAQVGDLFMSLIHTCELNRANAFDYLTELQKHAEQVTENPSAWMPWNYHDTGACG